MDNYWTKYFGTGSHGFQISSDDEDMEEFRSEKSVKSGKVSCELGWNSVHPMAQQAVGGRCFAGCSVQESMHAPLFPLQSSVQRGWYGVVGTGHGVSQYVNQLHAPLPLKREGVGIRQGGECNAPTPWAAVDHNSPIRPLFIHY
jgi:hypothetical protein